MKKELEEFCIEVEMSADYCDTPQERKVTLLKEPRYLVNHMEPADISDEITAWLESLPVEERVIL